MVSSNVRSSVAGDGVKFTVIIGNYFRISTRLNIFVESRKMHEFHVREFIINFCNFSWYLFCGRNWDFGYRSSVCAVKLFKINELPHFLRSLTLETSGRLMRVVCFWSFTLRLPVLTGPDLWDLFYLIQHYFPTNPKIIYLA